MLLVFVSDSFEEIAFCIFWVVFFCDLGFDQIVADKGSKVFKHNKISHGRMKKASEAKKSEL